MIGEILALDATGDTKLIWDSEKPDEVEVARDMFAKLKKKGYVAYSVEKKGDKGEIIRDFYESLERIIMAPPMKGG